MDFEQLSSSANPSLLQLTTDEKKLLDRLLEHGLGTTEPPRNTHLHRLRELANAIVGDIGKDQIAEKLPDCKTVIAPSEFIDNETKALELVVDILLQQLEMVCKNSSHCILRQLHFYSGREIGVCCTKR